MPRRRTHKLVGAVAGVGYAAYRAKSQRPSNFLVEAAGGGVGGAVGSALPDVFEPAVSSWHRGTGHSVAAGAAIVSIKPYLTEWENFCRAKAEQHNVVRTTPIPSPQGTVFVAVRQNSLEQLFSALAELFWRFLAGFLNGVAAGYVSHLALDMGEPRSIPLLTRGM